MVKKIEIERVSVTSYRPFDEVLAAINDCDRPSRYHGILEINSTDPQARKSPSSCLISQGFDSVAKGSECPDHSRGADSLGLFAY